MKTIGLIGGLSWESSLVYYRLINEAVKRKVGGLHSARCVMYSVDFGPVEEAMRRGGWPEITGVLIDAARRLKSAGADFVVICSNTMHRMADDIEAAVGIPVLHIADAAAARIKDRGFAKVGLLGTKYAMEGEFYRKRLLDRYGIEAIIPDAASREIINDVIFREICLGELRPSSREEFKEIIASLAGQGAEGIVLGCTEIPLLISQADTATPLFDTMTIHAEAAVDYALK